jgi:hypothetical protein
MSANFLKARDIEAIALSTIHTTFDGGVREPRTADIGMARPESSVDWILRPLAMIKRLRLALAFQR